MSTSAIVRLVALYALLAVVWILGSDALLHRLWPESAAFYRIGLYKGVAFVLATSVLLFLLLCRLARRERAFYRALFERLSIGVALKNSASGEILEFNPRYAEIVGHPPELLRGLSVHRITHPDDLDADMVLHQRLARREIDSFVSVKRMLRADGGIVWVRVAGSALDATNRGGREHYIAAVEDIGPRLEAERALRDSEARYRELFLANPHPMWVYHTETLAFLEVNEAAILRYGYSREEFLAMTLADIRPPEDVPRVLAAVRDGGPEPFGASGPWRHLKKDGGLLDVEIASHALRFEGHPARLVLAHDVTERLRAEAELRRFNELLERRVAERMADLVEANRELESFSYSVSHDLRAPLRAVSGFAQILSRRHGDGLDEQGRHYLDNIVVAARRMEALIEDLLRYSRVGRTMPPPLPVPMDGIVAHLKRVFAARVEASGGALEFLGEFPTPLGDAGTIERVLTNLIENALTYIEAGVPPRVEVSARGDAGEVEIAVRDNGLGVPDEYRERIFEVFQRLHNDEDYPGTGIGLAIVRKAVRAMGGSVTVEPGSEGGSVFRVRLPAAP